MFIPDLIQFCEDATSKLVYTLVFFQSSFIRHKQFGNELYYI
jgi:hypothetical protein